MSAHNVISGTDLSRVGSEKKAQQVVHCCRPKYALPPLLTKLTVVCGSGWGRQRGMQGGCLPRQRGRTRTRALGRCSLAAWRGSSSCRRVRSLSPLCSATHDEAQLAHGLYDQGAPNRCLPTA